MEKEINFRSGARYRCEQINVSKIDGSLVHFVEQKFQYLLHQSLDDKVGQVKLEEHIYRFDPVILEKSFHFISKIEFIKNKIFFDISASDGRIENIRNKKQINLEWIKFRDKEFDKDEFIQRLMKTNPEAVKELKLLGDKQFALDNPLTEEEYRRNLFYFICYDKFWIEEEMFKIHDEIFPFVSTLLPPIVVPIKFRYSEMLNDEEILKFKKTGSVVNLISELITELEKKYDEIHKPSIKYAFTEYQLSFDVMVEVNKKDQLVETADIFIREQVADNIENTCNFTLKRLHNYKPTNEK